jgi:hypothetical protein
MANSIAKKNPTNITVSEVRQGASTNKVFSVDPLNQDKTAIKLP